MTERRSKMKKLVAIAFLVLLAVGYVACGGNGYSSPTAPTLPSNVTPSPGAMPMPSPTPY
jgi:hypothetical protein